MDWTRPGALSAYDYSDPQYNNIIDMESRGNPTAVSPKGAVGVGQIMPSTARDPGYGVPTIFQVAEGLGVPVRDTSDATLQDLLRNPRVNATFGNMYWEAMKKESGGDPALTAARYNAGPGAVDQYGGVPPYDETQNYVSEFLKRNPQVEGASQGREPNVFDAARGVLQGEGNPDPYAPTRYILENKFPPAEAQPTLDQSNVAPEEEQGFLSSVSEWLTPERSERLLAIGAGMLSSNGNFLQQIGAGAGALGQTIRDQKGDALKERQFELMQSRGEQGAAYRYRPAGPTRMSDGSIVGNLVQDATTGRFLRPTADGGFEDVSAAVDLQINKSDGYGTKQLPSYGDILKTEDGLKTTYGALVRFDRLEDAVSKMPSGAEGYLIDIKGMFDSFRQAGASEEAIQRALAGGDIQGLLGYARESVVGGGVMTEQDALRVLAANGGDISIFNDPERMIRAIQMMRESALRDYEIMRERYESFNELPSFKPLNIPRYEGKGSGKGYSDYGRGALDQSNVDPPAEPTSVLTPEDNSLIDSYLNE